MPGRDGFRPMRKRELGEGEADPTAATAKRQRAAAGSGEAVEMDLRSSVSDSGCQQIGDRGSQVLAAGGGSGHRTRSHGLCPVCSVTSGVPCATYQRTVC